MNNSLPVFCIEYQLCMVKELLKYVWIHIKKLIHMFSTNSKRIWSYANQQIKATYHMNSNYDHQKPSQSADPQTIQLEDDGKSRKINSLVSIFEVAPVLNRISSQDVFYRRVSY